MSDGSAKLIHLPKLMSAAFPQTDAANMDRSANAYLPRPVISKERQSDDVVIPSKISPDETCAPATRHAAIHSQLRD
jgi:hypothetical protein